MTQEDELRIRQIFKEELSGFLGIDRYIFQRHIQMFDGKNIQAGRTTGTKIGTATDQKIGFYGITPVIQAAAIAAPSGGATIDAESRTAINLIRTAIKNFGITG